MVVQKSLKKLQEDSKDYALLVKFNDAAIEYSRTASNAQDPRLCGQYIQSFLSISENYKSIDFRFLKHLSLANCYILEKTDTMLYLYMCIPAEGDGYFLPKKVSSHFKYKLT